MRSFARRKWSAFMDVLKAAGRFARSFFKWALPGIVFNTVLLLTLGWLFGVPFGVKALLLVTLALAVAGTAQGIVLLVQGLTDAYKTMKSYAVANTDWRVGAIPATAR